MFRLLILVYALLLLNYLYGGLRFTSPRANLLFMAVAGLLPLVALIGFPQIRPKFLRILSTCGFALFALSSCAIFVSAPLLGWSRTELLYSQDIGSERIFVYKTHGGATTGNGIELKQEWFIAPGLLWSRRLVRLYPAEEFSLKALTDKEISVTHPQVEYEGEIRGGRTYTINLIRLPLPNRSPNKSLQRAALVIKCSAAGGRASRSMHPRRARVLTSQPAVAELNR
jgi:hypothetical protein